MDTLKNISFSLMLLLIGAIFTFLGLSGEVTIGNYSFPAQDNWARVILIVLGLIQIVVAIYLEVKLKPFASKSTEKKSALSTNANRPLSLSYDKFSRISEREFLNKIDLSKVSRLFVLGHTGRRVYEAVHELLEEVIARGEGNFPEVRVIIRAPIVEGLYRNNYIQSTIAKVRTLRDKKKNVEIRFYESIPAVRGIICEYNTKDKARDTYVTSYYWAQPNRSKAFDFAYVTRDSINSPKPTSMIIQSWMDQYWGKDEIHTVVFDFDDTLVRTREVQVKAWAQVIDEYLKRGVIKVQNLSSNLQNAAKLNTATISTDSDFLETISNIFIDKQLAEAIAQDIFVDVKAETLKQINKRRFEIRESMMEKAEMFEGAEKMLEKLHAHYNLAIISSTDETLISEFLAKKGLSDYFPIILGKRDPSLHYERENISHKTSLLIKLSEIIGIPLSRLVYIGDNNSDYLATKQLGIKFIEARQAAGLVGKESIITADTDLRKSLLGSFNSFEDNKLLEILRQHSQYLTRSKYQI